MADKKPEFHYGGQAVIEGVMMRGPNDFAVAVRRANGEIVSTVENVESMFSKLAWLKKPFLRGTLVLIDAMALGIKALKYATDIAMKDIAAEEQEKRGEASSDQPKAVNDVTVGAMMVLGLLGGVALFFFVPILLTKLLNRHIGVAWQLTAIEGVIKVALFVAYVAAISALKDVRRVFQYHGAEHKTINAYEAGVDLTVENVRRYTKAHVRCGTSFILVVLITGIIVFMLVADHLPYGSLTQHQGSMRILSSFIRWGYKLALLPFVAGISYEIIRMAGNCKESLFTKLTLLPGLLMQKITTREPDDEMIEVAIASLKGVLAKEEQTQQPALNTES
ncbi:MAG: DUF1385 domain-containing protein [Armatimonadota bacterium]